MDLILLVALKDEIIESQLDKDIRVVYTGIGKVNAAIKTFDLLYYDSMVVIDNNTIILNVGTAGSMKKDQEGTIKYCNKFIQRDCLPLRQFNANSSIKYDTTPQLIEFDLLDFNNTCNTGDNFDNQRRNTR